MVRIEVELQLTKKIFEFYSDNYFSSSLSGRLLCPPSPRRKGTGSKADVSTYQDDLPRLIPNFFENILLKKLLSSSLAWFVFTHEEKEIVFIWD